MFEISSNFTSGIIFLTNDGDFCNYLTQPNNKVVKKYYAITNQKLNAEQLDLIDLGIRVDKKNMKGIFNKYYFIVI